MSASLRRRLGGVFTLRPVSGQTRRTIVIDDEGTSALLTGRGQLRIISRHVLFWN
jgi:hypothetical protein